MENYNRNVLGVPIVTPKLNRLLGRVSTIVLMAMIFYGKWIQGTSAREKAPGVTGMETRGELQESLPRGGWSGAVLLNLLLFHSSAL